MSWNPTDDEQGGDRGGPQDDEDLGTAPTMLYMKPVSEDKKAKEVADDMGGETLMMMPAVPGKPAAEEPSGAPSQGPVAGPLPEGEGLEELDSAKTMVYMPAVGAAPGADAGGFSDDVQKKLAELRDTMGDPGDDAGSSTMAYMPAVGDLRVDQAVDRMLEETGEVPVQEPPPPRVATAPAFPAVSATDPVKDLGEAPTDVAGSETPAPTPAFKPGPDVAVDDDDDDLSEFTGKGGKAGKIFLILFVLILLGAGGAFGAMLFDWLPRPEFLDSLPHYQLDL